MTPDERGENYINEPTEVEPAEVPLEAPKGLDFLGPTSVNPEEQAEGEPPMRPTPTHVKQTDAPQLTSTEGLEHLFAELDSAEAQSLTPTAVAVRYLRVSTTRQMNTAVDIDEDGNSIATQRTWALKKNHALNASIGPEFVEPGQSAQTISKRPVFKEMVQYIADHPEVKYVVIYMRSRVFRNFIDAAITKRYLEERGVKLVSAKEEFGEGYMGDAMETITDVVNELQVRMSGEDIKVKLAHKVEGGGSVGRAKLGYLNVRKDFDGRLVNTIDVDPVRAPLVVWAFEEYATGEYSVAQLAAALEEQGLVTRPSQKYRSKALSVSALSALLGDPYYTGVIRYKGKLYPGRHQPLIPKSLYLKVKEVLASRNRQGDRDRVHFHYLKGLAYCEVCHAQGRESRLIYSQSTGNGGTYEYFTCSAKLKGECSMPGIRAEELEDAVAKAVATERIASDTLDRIDRGISEVIDDLQATERQSRDALRTQLAKIAQQEARLVDALADGDLPVPQLRDKLQQLMLQKGAAEERLARTDESLRVGADRARAAIDLVRDPGTLYGALPDMYRRELIQALFHRLYARVTDIDMQTNSDRTAGNEAIHALSRKIGEDAVDELEQKKIPGTLAEDLDVERESLLSQVIGSNKTYLVGTVRNNSNKSNLLPPRHDDLKKMVDLVAKTPVPEAPREMLSRRLRRRLSPELIAEIVAKYESGSMTPALCAEYGLSKTGILQLLRDEGAEIRRRPLTDEQVELAVKQYEAGRSIAAIAAGFNTSYNNVRQRLLKKEVRLRTRGGTYS